MTQQMKSHPGMVETIIDMLKHMDVDGETMQYILKETGMDHQMLKQLMLTSNFIHVRDFYREVLDQEDDRYLNDWDDSRGLESEPEVKKEVITELSNYILYVNTQETDLHNIEKQKESFKNIYFTKDNKDKTSK